MDCLDFLGFNPSDINPLCHSSEIEHSGDDIHAELVEDEDEEVMWQHVVYAAK